MKDIEDVKILVVGDVMVDRYVYGRVERICPEAPVPIFDYRDEELTLGGAGNVVKNLNSLGCHVSFIGLVGDDQPAQFVEDCMNTYCDRHSLCVDEDRRTTTKSRYVCNNKLLLREDYETRTYYDKPISIDEHFEDEDTMPDLILVSDYGKGFITERLMNQLRSYGLPILIDPYPPHMKFYNDCFLIKPNEKEYETILNLNGLQEINYEFMLVTTGRNGCSLYNNENILVAEYPALEQKNVVDICGAGDSFLSALSLSLGIGLTVESSIQISNECAAVVISQFGTSVISKNDFINISNKYFESER